MSTVLQKTTLDAHRFWPLQGKTMIETISPVECGEFLDKILTQVNERLDSKGVKVVFLDHVPNDSTIKGINPKRNLLLGIQIEGQKSEPIDILDLKTLDEKSLRPLDMLVEEVVLKVQQHLAAKKTQGIIISSSGSKFDLRKLEGLAVSIDNKGYLSIDGKRVFFTSEQGNAPVKAEKLRSYTITRLVLDQKTGMIRIFDDYDLIRLNEKGMYIDPTSVHSFAKEQLVAAYKEDAEGFENGYYALKRDQVSPSLKMWMFEKIQEFTVL